VLLATARTQVDLNAGKKFHMRRMTMKSLRVLLPLALLSLATAAFAQAPSEAQKSFDSLKALGGEWEGRVTVNPPMPGMSGDTANLHVSMRVTSRGHAIVHELQEAGTPLDAKKYDHPVTMLYLNGDQLNLVHYCDAGNRPHMVARKSEDGKTVEFDLVDISGGTEYGHMHHGVFTLVDADHHIEDWTYMMPGDKPVHAHFELHRAK
jgi:hypothetical protein